MKFPTADVGEFAISNNAIKNKDPNKHTKIVMVNNKSGDNVFQFPQMKSKYLENKNKIKNPDPLALESKKVLLFTNEKQNSNFKEFIQAMNESLRDATFKNFEQWFPKKYKNAVDDTKEEPETLEDEIKNKVEDTVFCPLNFMCEKDEAGNIIKEKKDPNRHYYVFNLPMTKDNKFDFLVEDYKSGKPYDYDHVDELNTYCMTIIMKIETVWLNEEYVGYKFRPQKMRVIKAGQNSASESIPEEDMIKYS